MLIIIYSYTEFRDSIFHGSSTMYIVHPTLYILYKYAARWTLYSKLYTNVLAFTEKLQNTYNLHTPFRIDWSDAAEQQHIHKSKKKLILRIVVVASIRIRFSRHYRTFRGLFKYTRVYTSRALGTSHIVQTLR